MAVIDILYHLGKKNFFFSSLLIIKITFNYISLNVFFFLEIIESRKQDFVFYFKIMERIRTNIFSLIMVFCISSKEASYYFAL